MFPKLTPDPAPMLEPVGGASAITVRVPEPLLADAADPASTDREPPARSLDTRSPEKQALAWLHTARFQTTASRIEQLPATERPEIAFVGRSNAGKSTAINTLTQQKRLAFASRTPGRTQNINLFDVGPRGEPDALLVDLPGYGYAAVARDAKRRWQEQMARYLQQRRPLGGLVMMVDSRLGVTDLDRQLLDFVEPRLRNGEVRLLMLLTKRDKLNRQESDRALRTAEDLLGEIATPESDVSVSLFSALSKVGVEDVAVVLHGWRQR